MNSWLKKLFGPDTEVSTKRFVMVVLLVVYIVSHFLTMYFKIEIANKTLVTNSQEGMFWLILVFGGFVTAEQFIQKWKGGVATNVVNQDVQNQTIVSDTNEKIKVAPVIPVTKDELAGGIGVSNRKRMQKKP